MAVLGGAAGLGGDEPGAPYAAGAHLVATDQERLDGAFDRRLADAARRGDPLAEANDARECVDDAESVGGRPRNQEPAVVGAEIERRVGPVGIAVGKRLIIVAADAVATHPVWRTARPAPPGRSTTVEAAGRRSLLTHSIPSCRAGTLSCSTVAGCVQAQIVANVSAASGAANTALFRPMSHVPGCLVALRQVHYVTRI